MVKYYTRACNFYYGNQAKALIKKKKAMALCGDKETAFDHIELFIRKKNTVKSKIIHLTKIKKLNIDQQKKILKDLKVITKKRKNFIKNIDFSKHLIMGILNLTPDSFSDGGKFNNKRKSLQHVNEMIKSGVDIIDVGGESTRPGSKEVDPKKEWLRIKNVVQIFKKKYKKQTLSLDTRKSDLMVTGVKYGVDLINDVSGFNYDKDSLNKLKNYRVAKVLHHMQGNPNTMQIKPIYNNVLLDIYDFFENSLKHRLKDKKVILDPGIGFGKTLKHNLTLISKISLFHSLGLPILVGTSRKRFINQISGSNDSKERVGGTVASIIYLLSQGVKIFRVHDVNEIKQGILVFKKIISSL